MLREQFATIAHLEGLEFIKALLKLEEERFSDGQFLKGSTFEDISADFGIFPKMAAYPVYFAGDITKPKDKIVFMGINPGFDEDLNKKEQAFLQSRGSFEGYCRLFGDFHFERKGLLPYYAKVAGFLRRYFDITETIDWHWFQEHFLTLELIPYHSVNAQGLRVNDITKYRDVYLEIILKILKHLDPDRPFFINGFPTYADQLAHREFEGVVEFRKDDGFWTGTMGKYTFIGLPFLNRPRGGVDRLVDAMKRVL